MTDRPLTAGDVLPMMALAMDKLMRAFPADCMPSASVCVEVANAVNAAKEILARPATSAASEGAVDRVMAVLNHWFDGRARIDRNSDMVAQLAALASPPVSERERELEGLVVELLKHSVSHYGNPRDEDHGVGLIHARARALTAQPAGGGK